MPKTIILLYHRVTKLSSDPQLLSITEDYFRKHLNVLKTDYKPLSLCNLVASLKKGKPPHKGVVVTFDDGYADNHLSAKPLLKEFNIPATFFVCTEHISKQTEFWWDELERLLLYPGKLKPPINSLGFNMNLDLNHTTDYSKKNFDKNKCWTVLDSSRPSPRHELYLRLCSKLRLLSPHQREQILSHLRLWADLTETGRDTHRALSQDQLRQLSNDSLFEIGSHTVSHSVLSTLSHDDQRFEIIKSKQILEKTTHHIIKSFSYPFGGLDDYTMRTRDLIREAGYECSCSNFKGTVMADTDIYQMPRSLVRNWNEDEFALKLNSWFKD